MDDKIKRLKQSLKDSYKDIKKAEEADIMNGTFILISCFIDNLAECRYHNTYNKTKDRLWNN